MDERRRFPRTTDSLQAIHEMVEAFLERAGLDPAGSFEVDLLIEELFTNMVKYNTDGTEAIEVGLSADGPVVTIMVRDFDVESFDPTRAPEVNTDAPLSERRRGGLGIHLVRQIADDVRYEYKDRSSTIIVTKRLES